MLGRLALVFGLVVSCSRTAPPVGKVVPPTRAAPAAAAPSASPVTAAVSTETAPVDNELSAAARTELVLSHDQARDVIVRFDSTACTSSDGTEIEIEIRIDDHVWDTFSVPTDNAPASCAAHGRTVEIGDYNFDGHPDLAVPLDNAGSYSGPTYAILLYQPLNGHYAEAPKLTALTRENLGLFRVDSRRRRLTVFNKSGCCIHSQSDITVQGDEPAIVSSQVESVIHENDSCRVTLERALPNGKTHTTTRRCNDDER